MSKQAKIIIFSIILFASFLMKHCNDDGLPYKKPVTEKKNDWDPNDFGDSDTKTIDKKLEASDLPPIKTIDERPPLDIDPPKWDIQEKLEPIKKLYKTPENGFSPYNSYFGNGIYEKNSINTFTIKNTNTTHAVVILVDAYSNRKIRNEFIRKGESFSMTQIPNGTYYLRWISGNKWSPVLKVGSLTGGFQSNQSFSETEDAKDWMKVTGSEEWTVTLYTVVGGTVGVEKINEDEFTD